MLTSTSIALAKLFITYPTPYDIYHEHDDCIRICHEWLSAQRLRKQNTGFGVRQVRNLIMQWGGSYVSKDDMLVAASMVPGLRLDMGKGNLQKSLTLPSDARLIGISQAFRHPDQRERFERDDLRLKRYKFFE